MYKLTSIRPRIDDIGHSRVRTWSASRRVFQRNDSWRRAFSFDSSPVACFTGKPIRREKQATESLYGGSIQATKGKTKHGYGVPIFPSFRLSSSRASCNPTKVLVFEARFRPATPNHRYISWYIRLIPLFHRLFVLWKNLRGKSSNDFDLLLRTIQRSLDNFPILRLTNFSVGSIVLSY